MSHSLRLLGIACLAIGLVACSHGSASYGAGRGDLTRAGEGLVRPVEGLLTSGFSTGGMGRRKHDGLDISAPYGSPIMAMAGGLVTAVHYWGDYGLIVRVNHGDGAESMYAHLSEALVEVGDTVAPGQEIARVGTSGNASGPHLHVEMRKRDELVDLGRYLVYQEYRR